MHTGRRNPFQLPEDEQFDCPPTQLIRRKHIHLDQIKLLSPVSNSSNTFATIDYEAQFNMNKKIFINLVFITIRRTRSLHTICETEKLNV